MEYVEEDSIVKGDLRGRGISRHVGIVLAMARMSFGFKNVVVASRFILEIQMELFSRVVTLDPGLLVVSTFNVFGGILFSVVPRACMHLSTYVRYVQRSLILN